MTIVVGALSPKENHLSIVIQIGIAVRGWRVLVVGENGFMLTSPDLSSVVR